MKKYQIAVTSADKWDEVFNLLTNTSSENEIPDREVSCYDDKLHSPTRGTFELTDEEAETLKTYKDKVKIQRNISNGWLICD